MTEFILASGSTQRRRLLAEAGYRFDVVVSNVDESPLDGESPQAHVSRLATAKSRAVPTEAVVLGADTVVVHNDLVLGKPHDAAEAADMLGALSGSNHHVLTGWALSKGPTALDGGVERTDVEFYALGHEVIEAYVATGEPLDKAGAYAIQGGGSEFVAGLEGSFSNVVGLPMEVVGAALGRLGIVPQR